MSHPRGPGRCGDFRFATLVFAGNASLVRDVMVGGGWVVREGRHLRRDAIAEAYRATITRLV